MRFELIQGQRPKNSGLGWKRAQVLMTKVTGWPLWKSESEANASQAKDSTAGEGEAAGHVDAEADRPRLAPRSKTNKKPPRNFAYMRWIKTLPYAVCGRMGSEAAHTGARGLRQKAPDERRTRNAPAITGRARR
ncbi:MAG: hypothetical protein HYX27_08315 [Acidobacteria bacterium]|nr:hypothetical protein [Acidobacteriota bacterium]